LALEMFEDAVDHGRVLDAGDDAQGSAAAAAELDVDVWKAPLRRCIQRMARCLGAGGVEAREFAVVFEPRPAGVIVGKQRAVGSKHPMEAREVHARQWDEGGEAGEEVERLEEHVGGAVAAGGLGGEPGVLAVADQEACPLASAICATRRCRSAGGAGTG